MSSEMKIVNVEFKGASAKPDDVKKMEEYGIDPNEVAELLNKKTKRLQGRKVSARIYVYPATKEYYVEIIPPNITELLLWKAGAERPSGDPAHQKIGNVTLEDMIHVAIAKKTELLTQDLKKAVKTVLGSARSIGLTVEGKDPKEVISEIEQNVYDNLFDKYKEEWEEA